MSDILGEFDIGDKAIVTITFADVTGGTAVSSACTVITKDPAGTVVSYSTPNASIANPSPNVYTFTMPTFTANGFWVIRAKSTATLIAAVEARIAVRASAFASP